MEQRSHIESGEGHSGEYSYQEPLFGRENASFVYSLVLTCFGLGYIYCIFMLEEP
jgi:hypothetical protein